MPEAPFHVSGRQKAVHHFWAGSGFFHHGQAFSGSWWHILLKQRAKLRRLIGQSTSRSYHAWLGPWLCNPIPIRPIPKTVSSRGKCQTIQGSRNHCGSNINGSSKTVARYCLTSLALRLSGKTRHPGSCQSQPVMAVDYSKYGAPGKLG